MFKYQKASTGIQLLRPVQHSSLVAEDIFKRVLMQSSIIIIYGSRYMAVNIVTMYWTPIICCANAIHIMIYDALALILRLRRPHVRRGSLDFIMHPDYIYVFVNIDNLAEYSLVRWFKWHNLNLATHHIHEILALHYTAPLSYTVEKIDNTSRQ